MNRQVRSRFWLEVILGTVTTILLLVTLVWRDWIEIVFGVEPDGGSGLLEWTIVGVLLVATIALFTLARSEWRRAQASA